jgi:NDP-sugar pyrophosphorylase family protein
MKAILLAAGLGHRLQPLTNELPKPLEKIGTKSNLERNIENLIKNNIDEAFINLHYLPEKIISSLNKYNNAIKIKYFYEKKLLGTAGALKPMGKFISNKNLLVLYADNFIDLEYDDLYKFHKKNNSDITMVLFEDFFAPETSGLVELNSQNRIVRFIDKPKKIFTNWADAGVYIMKSSVFSSIPNEIYSITQDLIPKLLKEKNRMIFGYKTNKNVISIDTQEKFEYAKSLVYGGNV